jgi:hypothetical protein
MFGAIPLNMFEGMGAVVVADIVGGLRGSVPVRDIVESRDATMESIEAAGSGIAGELGLWIHW